MTLKNWFRGESLGGVIDGFPYPERECPFCQQNCTMVDAIHVRSTPELYKALYICLNNKCEAYDEPARKAYARVYYSGDEALEKLELARIYYNRKSV